MSITLIKQQINRFLSSQTPEVISIKGAWGVGKTYAWNTYLVEAKNRNRLAPEKYAYVSLFGINSLAELKFAIFENLIDRKTIGRKPSLATFQRNLNELSRLLGGRRLLPGSRVNLERFGFMIEALAFLSLDKTLICIDDFERKGNDVETRDILGLITQLKEQKKCKIVLILNDENLDDEASVDYVKLREKVIDTELRFAPTAEDCVEIALGTGKVAALLREPIVRLGINNIRVIKKIESLAALLAPVLKNFDDAILKQALKTLSLLTWCFYSQSSDAPNYNFVISRTSSFDDLNEELLSTQQLHWCAILRQYDNFSMDEFDRRIACLVENGYVNEADIQAQAAIVQRKIAAAGSEHSFQEAWRRFYESFDDDSQEVIKCLSDSFKDNARHISPANLDGTVRLLRHLGRNSVAGKLIDLYIDMRRDEAALFSQSLAAVPAEIRDAEVIEKFTRQLREMRAGQPLREICAKLADGGGSDEEEERMSKAEVAEYVRLFKELKGPELTHYVDFCLSFGRRGTGTASQRNISEKATEALKIIGRESRLNASRVSRFGIRVG